MIRIGKYGMIGRRDAVCIGMSFLAVLLLTLLWGCGCKSEKGKSQPAKGIVLGNDRYEIDTVTLAGHRYFLIQASFGNVQLQHEESCKMRDLKSLETKSVKRPDILKALSESKPEFKKFK